MGELKLTRQEMEALQRTAQQKIFGYSKTYALCIEYRQYYDHCERCPAAKIASHLELDTRCKRPCSAVVDHYHPIPSNKPWQPWHPDRVRSVIKTCLKEF